MPDLTDKDMRGNQLKVLIFLSLLITAHVRAQDSEWPEELIKVEKINYERNAKASYCLRPLEMIDTIVFHHSSGPSTTSPESINEMHLNRGSASDPWYMIAYSYVVNTAYPGDSAPSPVVTEGRPLDIVGAHAGSQAFVTMTEEHQKFWDEGKIVCGRPDEGFSVDPKQLNNGKIKANVTTIGVVVPGNYEKFHPSRNPGGWTSRKPRYPTKSTQEMLAKLSCQLQKKHPRMKYLKWHNYYNSTDCPGNIKDYVDEIRVLAKGYGCEFN